MSSIYDIEVKDIKGQTRKLSEWKGKTLVIVNTASKCGFTPQYKGLEDLYKKYQAKGLVVMGYPCNQFGGQEPDAEAGIAQFCELNFGVSFPMFGKVEVNGEGTHPLFAHLKSECPGLLGTEMIKWNFTKFLVDKNGKVQKRFAPNDSPESMTTSIEQVL